MIQKISHNYFPMFSFIILSISVSALAQVPIQSSDENQRLLNEVVDISKDFRNFSNTYYLADHLGRFNPDTGGGTIVYKRYEFATRQAFNNMLGVLEPVKANEFPTGEYAESPELPFEIEFISPRTVRIRTSSRFQVKPDQPSLMFVNGTVSQDRTDWKYEKIQGGHRYAGKFGSVTITINPWRIEFRDAQGQLLTKTNHTSDNSTTYTPILPFSFVRALRIIRQAWTRYSHCYQVRKYSVAVNRLLSSTNAAKKLSCGLTIAMERKMRRCISRFRSS